MSFIYEEKQINSLFVDKIWHTVTTASGVYTANLDGNWDIIISRSDDFVSVVVNGIGKKAVQVPYTAGIDTIGIALKPGVFLRDLKGADIVDTQHVLTKDTTEYVRISGKTFKIPVFNSAEAFVSELIENDILLVNNIVLSFDSGKTKGISGRSLRRHVAQTTGLSPYFFQQIQRAQQAVQLLQEDMTIAQAAAEAGYADQAHMTKAVKLLMGRTPAQIIAARNN